jgi:hypothetical protein
MSGVKVRAGRFIGNIQTPLLSAYIQTVESHTVLGLQVLVVHLDRLCNMHVNYRATGLCCVQCSVNTWVRLRSFEGIRTPPICQQNLQIEKHVTTLSSY